MACCRVWNRVEQGKVNDEAVDFAERATLYNRTPNAAAFHTLAAVYAEVGRYTEARQAVLRSLVMRGAEEPGSIEWQVFGRIAEGYGEDEAAVIYYKRVEAPDGSDDDCEPCYSIAQERLKAMKAR